MDRVVATIALVVCIAAVPASAVYNESLLAEQWGSFKSTFNRTYTVDEEPLRMQAFKENLLIITEMNAEEDEATFGVNKFSDLRPEEFRLKYLGYRRIADPERPMPVFDGFEDAAAPTKSFDWRGQAPHPVTKVKDQGQCGSCWAFSATEGLEAAWILAGNDPVALSPQEIVSCDKQDLGCNGGDLPTALDFVKKKLSASKRDVGLTTEAKYPYKSGKNGKTGRCQAMKMMGGTAPVTTYAYAVPQCSKGKCTKQASLEAKMAQVLNTKGPLSICLNAGPWQSYKSGILKQPHKCKGSASAMDHCVQAVGYNVDGPTPYWIVRNSWNTDWGVKGFIYLAMNKNICGVANEAVFVNGE